MKQVSKEFSSFWKYFKWEVRTYGLVTAMYNVVRTYKQYRRKKS